MNDWIDLRSDTATRPSPGMRKAMAGAEVGDDVYGEDPTVNALQERVAGLFAREDSLFVPSGCMGNAICLGVLASPGSEVICHRLSHVFNYELCSMAVLSGLAPHVLDGPDGTLPLEKVESAVRPSIYYMAPTGCISLENTVNMAGGRIYPLKEMSELWELARRKGIPVHIDGARIFNAAAATGTDVAALTRGAECVMFCLSKGLGAPVGSMITGSREFIRQARRLRKLLGGGMRQVGVLAAAGLYALEHNLERLAQDHANARSLARSLSALPGLLVDPDLVETNILIVRLAPPSPTAKELEKALRSRRVLIDPVKVDSIRMVTHLDISGQKIDRAVLAFKSVLDPHCK